MAESTPSAEPTAAPPAPPPDTDVGTITKQIHATPPGSKRELLKRQVRETELRRDEPRKGVMEATEPEDRPSLGDVAADRAANRNVRVITTLQED